MYCKINYVYLRIFYLVYDCTTILHYNFYNFLKSFSISNTFFVFLKENLFTANMNEKYTKNNFLLHSLIHFILVKSAPHISHILSLKYGYTFHAFYLLFYATYLLIGLMLYKLSPNISILLLKGF